MSLKSNFRTTSNNGIKIPKNLHSEPKFIHTMDGCNQRFAMESMLSNNIMRSHNGSDVCEDTSKKTSLCQQIWQKRGISRIGSEQEDVIEWDEINEHTEDKHKVNSSTAVKITTKTIGNDQVFNCPVISCGQTFFMSKTLNDHIRSEHSVGKITCTQPNCHRVFTSEGRLKYHIFINHTQFRCHQTGCEFIGSKVELKQHQAVHRLCNSTTPMIRKRDSSAMETTSDWTACGFKTREKDPKPQHIMAQKEPQNRCDRPECDRGLITWSKI